MDIPFKKKIFATRSIFLFSGIGVASWAPMIPFVKMRLQLNEADLGMILLTFGIGALISMPLTGWILSRLGSRMITLISGTLLLILIPLLGSVPSVSLLSPLLFLFGSVTGALNIAMNAHAIFVEKESKQTLMSGFHSMFSAGGLLGALLFTLLLEANCSLLLSTLIISALLALLLFTQSPYIFSEKTETTPTKSSAFLLPDRNLLLLGGLCFILFLTEGAMLDWSALFLQSTLDYSPSLAGIGFALFSVAMALGRFFGDRVIHAFNALLVVQLGGAICISGLLMILYLHWAYAELLGFVLIGLGASNIVPILFRTSGSSYRLTVITTCGYGGLLLGPALIGFVANATTLSFALTALALLMSFVTLLSPAILPRKSATE